MSGSTDKEIFRDLMFEDGNLEYGDLAAILDVALDYIPDNEFADVMHRAGFVDFGKDRINSATDIYAADDDKINPAQERADELQDRIEDDFDYVLAGVERLGREGQLDAAIDIMEKIANTLDSAIGIIGEDFGSGEESDTEF
jgi:hypothetical protein